MGTQVIEYEASVLIGTENYQLVRTEHGRSWGVDYIDMPPYSQGTPKSIDYPMETWHIGGFKSRPGLNGTSEYGVNTDCRFPFSIRPSPVIHTVTLTGTTDPVSCIFEALGRIFAVAGRHVFRVNPADDTVVDSKDFGAGNPKGIMGLEDEDGAALVTVDSTTQSLYRLTALATPDVWTRTGDAGCNPYRLARGINRRFRISKAGVMRNVASGLAILTEANWADSVQCGGTDTSKPPTALVAYDRTVLAGKQEAMYAVDGESGYGVPVIKRVTPDSNNFYGASVVEPYLLAPTSRGLSRYTPGSIEAIGLEKELLNESGIKGGVFRGFAVDGQWIYGIYQYGSTNSEILVARDRRGNEQSLGPLIWDTWVQVGAVACGAIYLSTSTSPPRLWFANGNNLAYVKLADPLADMVQTATRYTHKINFDDWNDKNFFKITMAGASLTASVYWSIAYSIDGGAYQTTDINGTTMVLNSNSLTSYILPTTAKGREIQFRFTYTSNSAAAVGEIKYFNLYAIPNAGKVPVATCKLQLVEGARVDLGIDTRDLSKQRSDLEDMIKSAAVVASVGPWGSVNIIPTKIKEQELIQDAYGEQSMLLTLEFIIREAA